MVAREASTPGLSGDSYKNVCRTRASGKTGAPVSGHVTGAVAVAVEHP
jgi:hypothetical protein